jgi:hypothetical protein
VADFPAKWQVCGCESATFNLNPLKTVFKEAPGTEYYFTSTELVTGTVWTMNGAAEACKARSVLYNYDLYEAGSTKNLLASTTGVYNTNWVYVTTSIAFTTVSFDIHRFSRYNSFISQTFTAEVICNVHGLKNPTITPKYTLAATLLQTVLASVLDNWFTYFHTDGVCNPADKQFFYDAAATQPYDGTKGFEYAYAASKASVT